MAKKQTSDLTEDQHTLVDVTPTPADAAFDAVVKRAANVTPVSLDPADVALPVKRSHRSLPERAEKLANGDPLAALLAMALDNGTSRLPSPETLERLVTLAEHVADRQAKGAYVRAFAALQGKLRPVTPTSSSSFGAYATLGDIIDSVRKPLLDEGFSLAFKLDERVASFDREATTRLTLTTTLTHVGGHAESSEVAIIVELGPVSARTGQPVRSVAQARAAAVTAARRLAVLSMLNLTTGEPEQDAAVAPEPEPVPEGVAAAEQSLRAVPNREVLAATWSQLPFAVRSFLQRARPELMEELKAKHPAAEAS